MLCMEHHGTCSGRVPIVQVTECGHCIYLAIIDRVVLAATVMLQRT